MNVRISKPDRKSPPGVFAAATMSIIAIALTTSCSKATAPTSAPSMNSANGALAHEKSNYLQMHKDDLVKWQPWSAAALASARELNKPVFVSIGFSACHWCHIMQKESFNDPATAQFLNDNFVCVLVDREERPDLDEHFAAALRALKVRVGWPMSVFLRADDVSRNHSSGGAFAAGTYYGPGDASKPGSFRQTLLKAKQAYESLPRLNAQTAPQADLPQVAHEGAAAEAVFKKENIEFALKRLKEKLDLNNGGIKGSRKYPPVSLLALADAVPAGPEYQWLKSFASTTRERMVSGQLYDALDGGFFRFTTTADWRRPHFEKMLDTNAQLAGAYLAKHDATIGLVTIDFILKRFSLPDGTFANSLAADSEADGFSKKLIEGGYYIFTFAQMRSILNAAELGALLEHGSITENGNCSSSGNGANLVALADGRVTSELVRSAIRKLRLEQSKRPLAAIDKSVSVAANGMAISALVKAYRVSGNREYIRAAEKAATAIWKRSLKNGRLMHSGSVPGFLDDYVYFERALLDLCKHSAVSAPPAASAGWKAKAAQLDDIVCREFLDSTTHLYFYSLYNRDAGARILATTDGTASAAGVAVENLLRLGKRIEAKQVLNAHGKLIQAEPVRFASMLENVWFQADSNRE